MSNKNNKNKILWIIFLLLGGFLFKLFSFIFRKKNKIEHNLQNFLREEKKEITELKTGKESFKKYCNDSLSLFNDYFIPHLGNDHKPKILRTKSLAVMGILLLILKLSVTGYLFLIYPNKGEMSSIITQRVFELINIDRQENQLPKLALNSILNNSAKAKANDMIVNNYFAHHSPTGVKPWDWINRSQYPYLFVGENLAMNFNTADAVHKALMDSPSHKSNILHNRYNEVGIAMTTGKINDKETNILVELFAQRSIPSPAIAEAEETSQTVIVSTAKPEASPIQTESPINEIKDLNADNEIIETKSDTTEISNEVIPIEVEGEVKKDEVISKNDIGIEEKVEENLDNHTENTNYSKEENVKKAEADSLNTKNINTVENEDTEQVDNKEIVNNTVEIEFQNEIPEELNKKLEENLNKEIQVVNTKDSKKFGIASFIIKTSKYIYTIILIFVIIALIANILIRITVQHKHVIIQSLILIIFIVSLITMNFHFMEGIVNGVSII